MHLTDTADPPSALNSLSVISFRRGHWLDMEVQSTASLKLGAGDALAHINRGSILQRSGKLDAAYEEFRVAYQLAPSNAYVVVWLWVGESCSWDRSGKVCPVSHRP